MLITREIKPDGTIEALYESSNIVFSRYNNDTRKLTLVFKGGVEYHYEGVSNKDYTIFEVSESQGKVFNKTIKEYKFTKGDKVDVNLLRERIQQAKQQEVRGILKEIVSASKSLINVLEQGSDYPGNQPKIAMDDVTHLINVYKEKVKQLHD